MRSLFCFYLRFRFLFYGRTDFGPFRCSSLSAVMVCVLLMAVFGKKLAAAFWIFAKNFSRCWSAQSCHQPASTGVFLVIFIGGNFCCTMYGNFWARILVAFWNAIRSIFSELWSITILNWVQPLIFVGNIGSPQFLRGGVRSRQICLHFDAKMRFWMLFGRSCLCFHALLLIFLV